MKSVLIISPQKESVGSIRSSISSEYQVEYIDNFEGATNLYRERQFDLVLFDIDDYRGDASGQHFSEAFKHFKQRNPLVSIVALTSKENIRETVKAVKAGADDYLTYPIEPAEFTMVFESLDKSVTQNLELDYLRDKFWKSKWRDVIHTRTARMKEVFKKIRAVAPTKATVLLIGETGTGKGVLASLLHRHSNRCDDPFISVHCGAIPDTLLESELFGHEKGAFTGAVRRKPGKFEMAGNGTILLDEIGTITPSAQVKLLQILQDGTFSRVGGEDDLHSEARVIAATNANLAEMSDRGAFRKDLYYRLNVFPIEIPSLRERAEDIPYLVDHFLEKLNMAHGKNIQNVHPHVTKALQAYNWPGNIRELENLMERAYILETTSVLTPENFPAELFEFSVTTTLMPFNAHHTLAEARRQAIDDFERQYLKEIFTRSKGRVNVAAKEAGISARQLNKLMARHGIQKEAFKS
jgi:DNA-binding NtrC family response regulator